MATLLATTSSRGFITVKLLTALLAATLLLPSTNAAAYPNCPLTGKPPTKPTVPPTRCVGASNLTCCSACSDINFAVQALAVNVTAAVEAAAQGLIDVSTVPNSICPIMKGNEMCERLIEQLACAVQCNPDSGNYLTGKPGKYMLQICTDHGQAIYDACSSLEVAGIVVADFFTTPDDIIQQLLVPLVAQQIPGFNATVAKTACYSGPTLVPVTPLCCDPLTIPATCPPGAVNMTAAKNVSGRPLDPAICADFPYSNATMPFPPNASPPTPSAPAPSPPAPAPSPPAPAPSPPAPAPSPPAPAPAPTIAPSPPSTVSPFPPSASPPPPVPTPPPPPPNAAGVGGASLAVAVLPLLAVVLMAVVKRVSVREGVNWDQFTHRHSHTPYSPSSLTMYHLPFYVYRVPYSPSPCPNHTFQPTPPSSPLSTPPPSSPFALPLFPLPPPPFPLPFPRSSPFPQVHCAQYLAQVCQGALPSAAMRRIGFPWSPTLVRRTLAELLFLSPPISTPSSFPVLSSPPLFLLDFYLSLSPPSLPPALLPSAFPQVAGMLDAAQLALEHGPVCSTAGGMLHRRRGGMERGRGGGEEGVW
ncbi:unnamed protein product [Closterium sp. NIES-64]|nr:unnamed protein product [Closterium sp. NIES-64]